MIKKIVRITKYRMVIIQNCLKSIKNYYAVKSENHRIPGEGP